MKAMAAKGGVIGVCGLPQSLADGTPTLDDVLAHVDDLTRLAGTMHVGIETMTKLPNRSPPSWAATGSMLSAASAADLEPERRLSAAHEIPRFDRGQHRLPPRGASLVNQAADRR